MEQENASDLAAFMAATGPIPGELRGDRIDRILDTVRSHLGMEIAFVSRYVEGDEREFTHMSSDLPLPHGAGHREPKEDSFCFHILEGRLPQLIPDAQAIPFARSLPITDILPVGCHLNVPLRLADGSVYGSFCALSRVANHEITERDMGVLNAFAELAVESIESELSEGVVQQHLADSIAAVMEKRQLTIVHQPIHSLVTGLPVGVECLARFPDAGTRGPDLWFDEAAQVGLGLELEMFAIRAALETLGALPEGRYASINASPDTILSGELHNLLHKVPSGKLVVEVTEHAHVTDYDGLAEALRGLSKNARVAIDDVGAGYAGLRHIVDLSPDILKLDMSLTRDVHLDKARHALSSAMVRFAAEIGANLVAEGIECAEEAAALAAMGIDYGQGYYYARPMPVVRAQRHMLGLPQEEEADSPVQVSANQMPMARTA
ncbi:Cyclic-guanylate-specific phosphodiesterase [Alteripontixanthobacter maritimus]|uniref:Cyclic-guanylate-specific phosphodiesterase n=1 Tax=Alteripontixanthobacter maritimus TaxID=2161824 RepID=A0A369QC05_9SPHN|nr:EAL domain-containing protein [Alteripontixanthobacter maritimus]RDC60767.1 Cyclic-guanylate-specific phosphodiesterase [Alteripontixanthobacter maritimus]